MQAITLKVAFSLVQKEGNKTYCYVAKKNVKGCQTQRISLWAKRGFLKKKYPRTHPDVQAAPYLGCTLMKKGLLEGLVD